MARVTGKATAGWAPIAVDETRTSGRVYAFSDGDRRVIVELGLTNDRWEVVGLDVRGYTATSRVPVNVRELRRIPFGVLVSQARSRLRMELEDVKAREGAAEFVDAEGRKRVRIMSQAAEGGLDRLDRRRGRPQQSDEELGRVANVYRSAMQSGDPPTLAVGREFRQTPSTAAKWVYRARKRGFLGPTRRGVPAA